MRLECNITDHECHKFPLGEDACSMATRIPPHTASADTRHGYITHLTEFGYPARFVQVLLSPQQGVHDVQHEAGAGGDLCGGGGY
jgi:hypothetical protein